MTNQFEIRRWTSQQAMWDRNEDYEIISTHKVLSRAEARFDEFTKNSMNQYDSLIVDTKEYKCRHCGDVITGAPFINKGCYTCCDDCREGFDVTDWRNDNHAQMYGADA